MERRAGKRPCAEFPNDNPALHAGAIWWCAAPCAPATCELPAPAEEDATPVDAAQTDPVPPVVEADHATNDLDLGDDDDLDLGEDIEIVDELPELPFGADELPAVPAVQASDAGVGERIDDALCALDAVEEGLDDGLEPAIAHVDDEAALPAWSNDAPATGELPLDVEPLPPMEESMADSFQILVRVIEEVAKEAGAGEESVKRLQALLGRSRLDGSASDEDRAVRAQALAWQTVLNGEGDDFDACGGAMLDDWSSVLIARVLGQPGRTDGLKRALRQKGVAAFGIVEQAA